MDRAPLSSALSAFLLGCVLLFSPTLAKAFCGDNVCQEWEDPITCPADCGFGEGGGNQSCGDGTCDAIFAGENIESCPADCNLDDCGDGVCQLVTGESNEFCPQDCPLTCGDGNCSLSEADTCPADCGGCGDLICSEEFGENIETCPIDCSSTAGKICGDGFCNPETENFETCPQDCLPLNCGDGACISDEGENCQSCAADCGACPFCGDGQCNEDPFACPQDCSEILCGDGSCDGFLEETCDTCPADCGACPFCGDEQCNGGEDCASCSPDCGECVCGDGACTSGSGETPDSCPSDCGMANCSMTITLYSGSYGNEVSWQLKNSTDDLLCSGPGDAGYSSNQDYLIQCEVSGGPSYTFECIDSLSDGWDGAHISMSNEEGTGVGPFTFTSGSSASFPFTLQCPSPPECGDGTCNGEETSDTCLEDCPLPSCGDEACNGEETCEDCDFDCGTCFCTVICTMITGSYGHEVSWSITDSGGVGIANGPPDGELYADFTAYPSILENTAVGDYTLWMVDAWGDGWNGADMVCGLENETVLISTTLPNGALASENFTVFCAPPPAILGCTDPGAPNYDPEANTDDGSCLYALGVKMQDLEGDGWNGNSMTVLQEDGTPIVVNGESSFTLEDGFTDSIFLGLVPAGAYQFVKDGAIGSLGCVVGDNEVNSYDPANPIVIGANNVVMTCFVGAENYATYINLMDIQNEDGNTYTILQADSYYDDEDLGPRTLYYTFNDGPWEGEPNDVFDPSYSGPDFPGVQANSIASSEPDLKWGITGDGNLIIQSQCGWRPLYRYASDTSAASAMGNYNSSWPMIDGAGNPLDLSPDSWDPPGCSDNCPDTPNADQADGDGDGVGDACDNCPNDGGKTEEGVCGCGTPDTDSDGDQVFDCEDLCPNDPLKIDPGICGCEVPDVDTDGDGTPDCEDNCPNNPLKIDPGICGCEVPDVDTDADGTLDCNDLCPNDPLKIAPGICGCGISDIDNDADGAADCNDLCPNDPLKIVPGICGCEVPDGDSDGDQTADCEDDCPDDPNKTVVGICGCGVADTDSDGDEAADCDDGCPNDPDKTEPGICGCGASDEDSDGNGTADCLCGDGVCSSDGEDCANCPGDCGCVSDNSCELPVCADGVCTTTAPLAYPHAGCKGAKTLMSDGECCPIHVGPRTPTLNALGYNGLCIGDPSVGIWFVSPPPLGSDIDGDGSAFSPFETIQKAVDTANDFDTVCVDIGLYDAGADIDKPITILGSGALPPNQSLIFGGHFLIQTTFLVDINHLAIVESNAVPAVQVNSSQFVALLDLFIERSGEAGVEVLLSPGPGGSSDESLCKVGSLRHNFEGCYLEITSTKKGAAGNGSGLLTDEVEDVFVGLSRVHDNAGPGFTLIEDDATLSGNVIENNTFGVVVSDPIENLAVLQNDVNTNTEAGVAISQEGSTVVSAEISNNEMVSNGGEAVAAFNGTLNDGTGTSLLSMTIHGNSFTNHSGATIFTVRTPVSITDNVIVGTTGTTENTLASGRAIEIQRSDTINIEGNVIENSEGGAIFALLTELTASASITDNLLFDPGLYAISLQGPLAEEFQCNIPASPVDPAQTIQVTENTIDGSVGAGVVLESIHQPINFVGNEMKNTKILTVLNEEGDPETMGYEVSVCAAPFQVSSNVFDSSLPLNSQVNVTQALSIDGSDSTIGPGNTYSAASPEVSFFDPEGDVSILDPGITPTTLVSCPFPCPYIPQDAQKTKDAVDSALP